MKIIVPSVEIMRTGVETEFVTPEQFIEKVGRTCYKSEDKITDDSATKFVSNLIKRGHEAMIEHWNLIFKTDAEWYEKFVADWNTLLHDGNIPTEERLRPYMRFTDYTVSDEETRYVISGNMRTWRDYIKAHVNVHGYMQPYLYSVVQNYPLFFPEYQEWIPIDVHIDIADGILKPIEVSELSESERRVHQDITVKFICDRGVSHELVRHRVASFAQESTRYCNYILDKFGNEITAIRPSWCEEGSTAYNVWFRRCQNIEDGYFELLNSGASPQEARSLLPNSLKTEIIVTMNLDGWDHFFGLRCDKAAHPDMQEVANMTNDLFWSEVYYDLYGV